MRAFIAKQAMRMICAAVFAIVSTSALSAQANSASTNSSPPFSVHGTVVDTTGSPLNGADIFSTSGQRAISDASGDFVLTNLTDRSVSLVMRRIGYTPVSIAFKVQPDMKSVNIRAKLVPVSVSLGTVVIEGRAMDKDLWEKGFYKRMNGANIGTFFPPERLTNSAIRISTLVSEVPRVNMSVGPGGVAVPRAPIKMSGEYCTMSAVIDGVAFSPAVVGQVGIDNLVNVSEVKAMEVYLRAGRIPNALAGRGGMQSIANSISPTGGDGIGGSDGVECGTIVIWTKDR